MCIRDSDDIIKKFQLGYSPEQKDAFTKYALEKGYEKEILEKSGISIFPENTPTGIDRFRERVIFPIHSFSGRVLGFGARILKSNVKTAKYLNSPETEIYHKSNVLYGLNPVSYTHLDVYKRQLLIESWRKNWGYDFPFYFVQLATFGTNGDSNSGSDWAELREAQTLTLNLKNTAMVVTTDVGNAKAVSYTHLDVYKRQQVDKT